MKIIAFFSKMLYIFCRSRIYQNFSNRQSMDHGTLKNGFLLQFPNKKCFLNLQIYATSAVRELRNNNKRGRLLFLLKLRESGFRNLEMADFCCLPTVL